MDIYGIEPHLRSARALMDDADAHATVYAALERRFCFEARVHPRFSRTLTRRPIQAMRSVHVKA